MISFGIGLLLVAAMAAVLPSGRRGVRALGAALRSGELAPWQCLGGLCGAAYVASQGVSAAALGVAVFTVSAVAGQTVSGLAVDRLGLGPAKPHAITGSRAVGAALAVVAVAVAAGGDIGGGPVLALAALPAVSGVLIAWQQAVNGRIQQASRSTLTPTLVNFTTGTTGLLVALAIDLALRGPTRPPPSDPVLYLGGLLGVAFIAVAAAVVRHTGVLLMGLGMIAGQVSGAVVIDLIAPPDHGRPGLRTLTGAALALSAVVVATVSRGTPRRSSTSTEPTPTAVRPVQPPVVAPDPQAAHSDRRAAGSDGTHPVRLPVAGDPATPS